MDKKVKKALVCTGAVTLTLLSAISLQIYRATSAFEKPSTPPAYHLTYEDKALPKHSGSPMVSAQNSAQAETPTTLPTEIDFKPAKPNEDNGFAMPTDPLGDNTTLDTTTAPSPRPQAPAEPKMGDSRMVNGQKQSYILGFGWIDDNSTPNEVEYLDDMVENGNKIGTMGSSGTLVDGDGDINKMVGTMGGGEVGRSCGDINKTVGQMD